MSTHASLVREEAGIVTLTAPLVSEYSNHDLAPTTMPERKWGMVSIATLWISMSACVPTYTLASSMIGGGMNWWQAVLTIFLGNVIVLLPMVLNAHAGTRYGIPFPVYCRAAFGILGANVPAVLRALVACGWFGIQAWIGGAAIYSILGVFFPQLLDLAPLPVLGINLGQLACFLLFWGLNVLVIWRGVDSIRILLNVKAPLLILMGLALLAWAHQRAGGFGPMLSTPSQFDAGQPKQGQFLAFFFPALTGAVGFWATLSLNIPDFTRYAKTQRDQIVGQTLGLPATMGLYSFIGVAVTSATVVIYGEAIWDPIVLVTKFENPVLLVVGLASLALATLATNIAANVVSPANDFANLAPKTISFKTGGYITAAIGVLIMPWKLVADPSGYIFTWLVGYSALLGSIGGVLIGDYFILRKRVLDLPGLYEGRGGPYWYTGGFSPAALLALGIGIFPNLPGFLGKVEWATVPAFWVQIYDYAWFVGFVLSMGSYVALAVALGVGKQSAPRSLPVASA
jgi:NCS1 family nucleobase:cation symporter-1